MTPHPVDLEALAGRQPTHDEISALLAEVRAARQAQLRLGEAAIALCARGLLMVPTAVVFDWLQIIRRAALASTSVPPPQDAARWLKAQDKATAPPVLEEKAQEAGLRPTPRTEPKCMQPPDQPEFWCRYDGSKHSIYCPLFSDNLRGAPPAPALPKEEVAPLRPPIWPGDDAPAPQPLEEQLPKEGSAAAPAPGDARVNADDHPGGPLSRAERVLLSNMKREAHRARIALKALDHVIGAVPGSQKIDAARADALAAINRMLDAFKMRKQGAPSPRARASDATSAGGGPVPFPEKQSGGTNG